MPSIRLLENTLLTRLRYTRCREDLGQQRLDHLIPLLIDGGDILIGRTGIEQRAEGLENRADRE